MGREWCHQFDLTKGLTEDAVCAAKLQLTCCCTQQQQGADAVRAAAVAAAGFLDMFQFKGPIPGEHTVLAGSTHRRYVCCDMCSDTCQDLLLSDNKIIGSIEPVDMPCVGYDQKVRASAIAGITGLH